MKFTYKVGDKALVIKEICGHQFKFGQVVSITAESGHHEHFRASDGKDEWYVSIDELVPYEPIKEKILEEIQNG